MGRALGEIVFPGIVIAVTGVLGSGKTLLVQGIAEGLGVPEACYVTSPSYTLVNEYSGRCTLHHADLYRLGRLNDIESTGLYDMLHGAGVVVIEWAERMLPEDLADHLAVHVEVKKEFVRAICLRGYGQCCSNLLRELHFKLKERACV